MGDEEFRPDIVLLVNGMPLAFVEVKVPNNKNGILAVRDRLFLAVSSPQVNYR